MTADEYLGQYRLIEAEIKQREKLINRMRREIFSGPTDNVIANIYLHHIKEIGRASCSERV